MTRWGEGQAGEVLVLPQTRTNQIIFFFRCVGVTVRLPFAFTSTRFFYTLAPLLPRRDASGRGGLDLGLVDLVDLRWHRNRTRVARSITRNLWLKWHATKLQKQLFAPVVARKTNSEKETPGVYARNRKILKKGLLSQKVCVY